ncbi:DUF2513 domain-containing protein [Pseudomonas sp. GD03651]|uniref:hypothetical protein n=1 Tax=Pseudomonas sp. GD03651 TaxID=2975361 RepID=UPI0024481E5A|nr:hypothetical protein [Pseudomonas sp. GD03651]MDH2187440.1 DUF2513 domain-containing protein [Pseudomonas sp. GD03651]
MQRRKELALRILVLIEDMDRGSGVDERNVSNNIGGSPAAFEVDIHYHLGLLASGGFLRVEIQPSTSVSIYHMTWAGHDLLDKLVKEVQ